MKSTLLILLFSVIRSIAWAQSAEPVYRIKDPGEISKVIPFKDRFQFDQFQDGKVHFRNGKVSAAKLNYSYVYAEIMFIAPKKDTLLLADLDYIHFVSLADRVYFYLKGHGHMEQIANFGRVGLGKKTFFMNLGNERYAAYGQYSSTSAISSYSSFINQDGMIQFLKGNNKVVMKKHAAYFFIDRNERFLIANRQNLLKVYSSHKKAINQYYKQHNPDFDQETDLKALLEFCSTL
ncbi:hypothetical protein [Dyadobacter sediminis]|uniref:Uncharacterized protein n=1 Tax=Dyadobacter sediminis TaxID=1493691 RepID=A0A5R9KIY7_9BACT|nr:hypothetical protein [Dyadobacter sediminis]TLU96180.1 hypothetical protein FEM55_03285 [Dyadobacter sediminis]GGB79932.1 hypothetical protein GCM10011325_04370 [Dyadobacter sediminis]